MSEGVNTITIEVALGAAVPERAPFRVRRDQHGWLWARDRCGSTYSESAIRKVLDLALDRSTVRPNRDSILARGRAEIDGGRLEEQEDDA